MIFLMMDAAECEQCNIVADMSLQNEELKRYIGSKFIALRIGINHPERAALKQTYNIGDGNMVLFLDEQGTLIHRFNQSSSKSSDYIREGEIAYNQKEDGATIRSLEQAALAGQLNTANLYKLTEARNRLGFPIDSLLDVYVMRLPVDSLKKPPVLQRIAQMSPILQSKADITLKRDINLFQEAWYKLPPEERVEINRRIINKTLNKAIRERNEELAMHLANFAEGTCSDRQEGLKARNYNLMEYYWGTGDKALFLQTAGRYYENYYMTLSADSIRKIDSLNLFAMIKRHSGRMKGEARMNFSFTSSGQFYCRELNKGAWRVYTLTDQREHLEKALRWAAHANTFFEHPEAIDTQARLLYKLKKDRDQAVRLEEKAIALLKEQGISSQTYEDVLQKMKKAADKIDEY